MPISRNLQSKPLRKTIHQIQFDSADFVHRGKVRDSFGFDEFRAIVVSDRVSAFDRELGVVPNKGSVLNQLTAWWFAKLDEENVAHHLINVVHPNVSLVRSVDVIPLEIIVRGYLTGTTITSAWHAYQHFERKICGLEMPAGMVKNQCFDAPILTPTTKEKDGDQPISRETILQTGVLDEFASKSGRSAVELWEEIEVTALKLFQLGQRVANERGLILVDTKYEMGVDKSGNLVVVDEVHTPDCSRFWVRKSYERRFEEGREPEALDKEFIRRMVVDAGFDVCSDQNPADFVTEDLLNEASARYLELYRMMTGEAAELSSSETVEQVLARISSEQKSGKLSF